MEDITNEWLFRYKLVVPDGTSDEESRALADNLVDVAIAWAEKRKFGFGGGVSPHPRLNWRSDSKYYFYLKFGLMPTRYEQSVSKESADELFRVLSGVARDTSADLVGLHTEGSESER